MQSIGKYNDPLLMAIANRHYAEEMKNNPKHKAYLKKIWKKTKAIIKAQCENGVGFITDETIRYFFVEYNKRNFEHGLDSMPSSRQLRKRQLNPASTRTAAIYSSPIGSAVPWP